MVTPRSGGSSGSSGANGGIGGRRGVGTGEISSAIATVAVHIDAKVKPWRASRTSTIL